MEVYDFALTFVNWMLEPRKTPFPYPQMQEAIEGLVGARYFSCLDLKAGFWQIAIDEVLKQYTAFTVGNLGFFWVWMHAHSGCVMPHHISKINAELPVGTEPDILLNLLRCCDCLFEMEKEHLQCLHIMFNCFREHNLRLKPTKCKFFQNEINYLAHHVSKEGVWPSKENLKAVTEFTPPWTYTEIWAFPGLVGHYQWFIKGFVHISQPLHKHLSGEGARKKTKWVTLTEGGSGCLWHTLGRLVLRLLCWCLLISKQTDGNTIQ